jgi:hypothetical protein
VNSEQNVGQQPKELANSCSRPLNVKVSHSPFRGGRVTAGHVRGYNEGNRLESIVFDRCRDSSAVRTREIETVRRAVPGRFRIPLSAHSDVDVAEEASWATE